MTTQTIINQNCLDYMKTLPDKSFDLVLTDPPYGIGSWSVNSTGGFMTKEEAQKINEWDSGTPSEEYFNEIFRISKAWIIWGGNYFSIPPSPKVIIWDKVQQGMHFAEAEVAFTSFTTGTTRIVKQGIKSSETYGNKVHPTQKPIELMRWCIAYADKATGGVQTILDPFMGSGTTLVACKHLGRNAVGIEISEKYCSIAQERLDSTPTPMF